MTDTQDTDKLTMDHLVVLTSWMADNGYTPSEIAYAVEKPWKHTDLLAAARGDELALARLKKDE